jgi:hypothetical protein
MKKYFIFLLILPFVFNSCKTKSHPKKVAQVDSIYAITDSIEKKLSTIDTLNIKKVFKEYKENIGLIGRYFDDKKDDSTWSTMTTYGAINNPLKRFVMDYPGLYDELSFSRGQLDSLKTDIENDKVSVEKMPVYIQTEADAVNTLKIQVDSYVNDAKANLKLFDSLNPIMKGVIEKLKKEKKLDPSIKSSAKGMDDD